jgi:hypothetical protein
VESGELQFGVVVAGEVGLQDRLHVLLGFGV